MTIDAHRLPLSPAASDRYRHPLESIPAFERIPPSFARDLLFTLLLCAIISLTFAMITQLNVPTERFSRLLYINGVFSLSIGYSIHILSFLAHRTVARWFDDGTRRNYIVGAATASLIGGASGYVLAAQMLSVGFRLWSGMLVVMLWITVLITGMVLAQRRRILSELAFERERSARVEAERLTIASRLQMLQAQIEPHFLFNTLANVSTLIEIEPKRARKMLDQLTLLLRAALDSTRRPNTSLRKELHVIDAYLAVLKVRMGERLSYAIEAPEALSNMEVPAMLLQPIVENAVKHGIEPRVAGGLVRIEVAQKGPKLELAVLDNGVGFLPGSRDNVGLGAVRERLAVQFGAAAELAVERTPADWTRVAIRIPMPT